MPDTEARLGYSKGVLKQIRAQHAELSREQLLDLVCALTKEYVLDKTIPFDFPLPERADELRADPPHAPAEEASSDPAQVRFARLIDGMKQRTRLPQFEGFSIEEGQAVLVVDNQKVVFGDRVTVRMVTGRRAVRPAPEPSDETPRSAPAPTSAAPAPTPRPATPAPAPRPAPPQTHDDDDEDDDAGVERFRGLDLG